MTEKETAKDYVNKHYSAITGMELTYISKLIFLPSGDSNYETAKKCAIISVCEIIKETESIAFNYDIDVGDLLDYWKEVKTKIEQL